MAKGERRSWAKMGPKLTELVFVPTKSLQLVLEDQNLFLQLTQGPQGPLQLIHGNGRGQHHHSIGPGFVVGTQQEHGGPFEGQTLFVPPGEDIVSSHRGPDQHPCHLIVLSHQRLTKIFMGLGIQALWATVLKQAEGEVAIGFEEVKPSSGKTLRGSHGEIMEAPCATPRLTQRNSSDLWAMVFSFFKRYAPPPRTGDTVQYLIARQDLEMSPGKMSAQCSHAATSVALAHHGELRNVVGREHLPKHKDAMSCWTRTSFAKVVLRVKSRDQLIKLCSQLEEEHIPYAPIFDACRTELVPEEPNGSVFTCIGLTPLFREDVPKFLQKLQVYR